MPSMDYCKFENLYKDMVEIAEDHFAMEANDLSESEAKYREKWIKLCKRVADDYADED